MQRRNALIFSVALGIFCILIAIILNVSWILISWHEIALLLLGIILSALIITGLILNTMFLIREIRRNELQDAFLNAVTHELKTPVASIKLYLETLKNRNVSEEKRMEFYDIMLADSNRLMGTVEQILQAARLREQRIQIASVNLTEIIYESIEITKRRYNLPDSAIKFNPPEQILVAGGNKELKTVFLNLLDNAVKYALSEPNIHVRIKNSGKKSRCFNKGQWNRYRSNRDKTNI